VLVYDESVILVMDCIQGMKQSCITSGANVVVDYYDNKSCPLDKDDAGLSWDAVSFTFLLIMSRVYKTWYFQHVVTDLKVDNMLASR